MPGRASGAADAMPAVHRSGAVPIPPGVGRELSRVDHQQVLVNRPEHEAQTRENADNLQARRTNGGQLPENETENRAGRRDDRIVNEGGEQSPLQGRTLQGYIDARTLLQLGLRLGLDRDSTQGRRRRDCFRDFQNARTINHRLGQFVKRGQGGVQERGNSIIFAVTVAVARGWAEAVAAWTGTSSP